MATRKKAAPKTKAATPRKRKKKNEGDPGSRGLEAAATTLGAESAALAAAREAVLAAGGAVIGSYKDPLGGHAQLFASLPIDKVEPTPFQRDISDTHVARLTDVLQRLDRFLDPIIATPAEGPAPFWTPNGNHRLHAMRRLGAKSILALIVPEREVAFRILALNTEKAHNLREKALEVVRMARALAAIDRRSERALELEFEEAALVTLGLCYEEKSRFSGGAYHSALKRVDQFLDVPLAEALEVRRARKDKLLELDLAVVEAVERLKAQGLTSPYLKNFVVSRVNPLRFIKGEPPSFDALLERMIAGAKKLDAGKIDASQVASSGGTGEE